ncbi:FtsB family cell division protein [Paraoerskovia sediminicola]|nr:septum formation initiator family protein [Paraoerskovia sediminicola]
MVMFVVVLVAIAMLLPTLRAYVNQAGELREVQRDLAAAKEQRDSLQVELDRWDDRSYVIAQARDRLSFVMPGETAYRVLDPGTAGERLNPDTGEEVGPGLVDPSAAGLPWYSALWHSVKIAGQEGSADDATGGTPADDTTGDDSDGSTGTTDDTTGDDPGTTDDGGTP